MDPMKLDEWKKRVRKLYPAANFVARGDKIDAFIENKKLGTFDKKEGVGNVRKKSELLGSSLITAYVSASRRMAK